MSTLAGPLVGLSFRRAGHHTGPKHTPQPPTNEERRRALLAVWPMQRGNDYRWPIKANHTKGNPNAL